MPSGRAPPYLRQWEEVHEFAKQEVAIGIVSGQILLEPVQVLGPRPTLLAPGGKITQHPHNVLDALVNPLQVRCLGMWAS